MGLFIRAFPMGLTVLAVLLISLFIATIIIIITGLVGVDVWVKRAVEASAQATAIRAGGQQP